LSGNHAQSGSGGIVDEDEIAVLVLNRPPAGSILSTSRRIPSSVSRTDSPSFCVVTGDSWGMMRLCMTAEGCKVSCSFG
jgi:hypothetical protein